jgi:hypothetical protein
MFKIFDNIDLLNTNILLAGCGGGYDCFTALPLYFKLKERSKNVFIANLSFTKVKYLNLFPRITNSCYNITYNPKILKNIPPYFPEYELSRELDINIYAFIDNGMKSYELAYIELVKKLDINIVILCDGGCDSIMTGIEYNLGTIAEDAMSILTVNKLLDMKLISDAYLLLLGSTVDTFCEIKREDFLMNIELLAKSKVLAEKILLTIDESDKNAEYVIKYKQICANCNPFNSIVNASICARLDGLYGNEMPPMLTKKNGISRCSKQHFYIDDYLTTYYLLTLSGIVNRMQYKHLIEQSDNAEKIDKKIMKFNSELWPKIKNKQKNLKNK